MIDINLKNIQNIHTRLGNIIKRKLKNFVLKINFLFSYYFSQPSYISVGCDEVSIFKKLYPKDSSKFLSYKHENLNDSKLKKNWIFFEKFLNRLKNVTNFESISRCRRKLQELHPDLRGDKYKARHDKQQEMKDDLNIMTAERTGINYETNTQLEFGIKQPGKKMVYLI